jgi:hypothetical protein
VLKVVEDVCSVNRESLAFCTQRCAYKKYKRWLGTSIRSPWLICTRCCVCKKYKIDRDINWESLTNLYALIHWPYVRSEVSPLRQSGTLISIWAKLHWSSWCAETFIAFGSPGDRVLKADRSLIDPIMKLIADCHEIQEYLRVSQYDSSIDTSHMRLISFIFFTTIGRLPDT